MDKINVIDRLATCTLTDAYKGQKVILLTSLGIVYGDIYIPSEVSNETPVTPENSLDWMYKVISDKDTQDVMKDFKQEDNSLMLKNVQLEFSNGNIKKLPFLFLFADQIIGILLGNVHRQ